MLQHMTGGWDTWSGDDWQNYCRQLLNRRYGVSYQPVPDRDQGDFGIEGFTSSGEVFQCYAPEDPRSQEELYKKQRNKITADLRKLERNLDEIGKLTAPYLIAYWVLLVPRCDTKRIIQHGAVKATELRGKGLDGIHDGFQVRVLTDEDFGLEKQQLEVAGVALLPQPLPDVTEESAQAWSAKSPDAVARLNEKIANLPSITSNQRQRQLSMDLIKYHLRGAGLGEQIRSAQPQMWEFINRTRNQRERLLSLERAAATPGERLTLTEEVKEFQSRLESGPWRFDRGLAEDLTWGIVADWLIRCPLVLSHTAAGQ